MKFRPEAEIYPLMSDEALKDLAKDIDEHGQLHPISLYQGDILDGRNRYLAITRFGSNGHKPKFVDVNPESPIAFVVSGNEKRRHLKQGQVDMAAARALPFYEAEANRRKSEAGRKAAPGKPAKKSSPIGDKFPARKHLASDDVAADFGTSPRNVQRAKRVQTKAAKKVADLVDQGDLSLGKAEEIVSQNPDKKDQEKVADEIVKSKMVNRVKGLTGEVEWYTPRQYLDAAVEAMGAIDLDPASSEAAQENVRAGRYFTREDNGLEQRWSGRVFLNPPYSMPSIGQFVGKMVAEYQAGNFDQGILLTNNATDTSWFHLAAANCSALCFTKGRIHFLQVKDGELLSKNATTQGQVFFYFGRDWKQFREVFTQYGLVLHPGI